MTHPKSNINRRDLLKSGAIVGAGLALGVAKAAAETQTPFRHGVASGDPLSDRVILWTRLTLPKGQKAEQVIWQVATDQKFKNIIRQGKARAEEASDRTIKIDCDGLKEGTAYFYAFRFDGHAATGRTKTLPKAGVKKLKLGVASCANYNAGYFTSYRGLAQRGDLDAVVHLGDYIYEYASGVYGKHKARTLKPPHEVITLDDYRTRYAHYRADPDLQAFHAQHPVIAVWDDHEIANNSWRKGAENHDPEKEGVFSERQLAARQAYFEWLPIRPRAQKQIYRRFAFGDLAHLIMIDTRHDGRAEQLEFKSFIKPPKTEGGRPSFDASAFTQKWMKRSRRIISRAQELWLKKSLREAKRNALWTLIGNQVNFTPALMPDLADTKPPKFFEPLAQVKQLAQAAGLKTLPLSLDSWSGYPAAQKAVEDAIAQTGNPTLILTGDTHHGWATPFGVKPIGTELGGPGVSSPGLESYVNASDRKKWHKKFRGANPNMSFFDTRHRGFMVVEITRDKADAQWVWADISRRRGKLTAGPRLMIKRDQPGRPRRAKPRRI